MDIPVKVSTIFCYAFKQCGREYQKAQDWHAFVVQDGLIITGQNPASSALAADKLLTHLSA